jgi:hypothetical protein
MSLDAVEPLGLDPQRLLGEARLGHGEGQDNRGCRQRNTPGVSHVKNSYLDGCRYSDEGAQYTGFSTTVFASPQPEQQER